MAETLNLSQFLPYQLSVASNAVSDQIARHYQTRFGLKIPEWRLVAVLGQGDALSQRALVAATRMDKVTVSRATASLVDRGLITRQASVDDGRSHLLALTAAGIAMFNDIAPAAQHMEQRIFACLTKAERTRLSDMLDRLRDAADAI